MSKSVRVIVYQWFVSRKEDAGKSLGYYNHAEQSLFLVFVIATHQMTIVTNMIESSIYIY